MVRSRQNLGSRSRRGELIWGKTNEKPKPWGQGPAFPPSFQRSIPQCLLMWNLLLGENLLSDFINICESKFNKAGNSTTQLSCLRGAHSSSSTAKHLKCKELLLQQQREMTNWWVTDYTCWGGNRRKNLKGSLPGFHRSFQFLFPFIMNGGRTCILLPTIIVYYCFIACILTSLSYGCGICMSFAQNTKARRVPPPPCPVIP